MSCTEIFSLVSIVRNTQEVQKLPVLLEVQGSTKNVSIIVPTFSFIYLLYISYSFYVVHFGIAGVCKEHWKSVSISTLCTRIFNPEAYTVYVSGFAVDLVLRISWVDDHSWN